MNVVGDDHLEAPHGVEDDAGGEQVVRHLVLQRQGGRHHGQQAYGEVALQTPLLGVGDGRVGAERLELGALGLEEGRALSGLEMERKVMLLSWGVGSLQIILVHPSIKMEKQLVDTN